ncbi:MAG: hypothetical protein HY514_01725 [Candidatus Aenigmarchaeota archaeon]|nr:hypothetical protein [Candidatus Aenigmarchaeota archaeon]
MAFESLFTSLLSVGGIISLVVNVIVTAIAIMIADKIITHEIEIKHSLIMAFIAYFILPLALSYLIVFVPVISTIAIILPLIVWIILGEVLLKADRKQKAIVAIIAYAVNLLLLGYVSGFIFSLLPF